jgi:phage terminase small subunit
VSAAPSKKLSSKEAAFVDAYLGIAAGNATKAATLAGYAKSSAHVTASRLLRKAHIKAKLLSTRIEKAADAIQADTIIRTKIMGGDEALERLSLYARADIGAVLGPDDPISQLPAEVRATIKGVRETPHGRNIELYDSMRATELLAKAGGKLKEIVQVESLEDLIAQSRRVEAAVA